MKNYNVKQYFLVLLLGISFQKRNSNVCSGLSMRNNENMQQISTSLSSSRRIFFRKQFATFVAIVGSSGFPSSNAFAMDVEETSITSSPSSGERKPYAPVEALLPAIRLKLWVDEAYELASLLATTTRNKDTTSNGQVDLLNQLNDVLSHPPKFFAESPTLKKSASSPPSGSTAQLTTSISSINKVQYQQNRQSLSSLGDRMTAMLNQADVERQWGMLQYQEMKKEQSDPIRAVFNTYTSQLVFGDTYLLTTSPQDKKRMIRQEELPTLAAVVTSDLDLRDLYRNQFLTSFEDLKAEVTYQVKELRSQSQSSESSSVTTATTNVDVDEIMNLMKQSYTACTNWFNLIPSQDVQDAISIVQNEKK